MTDFRSPRPNLFNCGDSFSVEVLGRTGLRYVEGERSMVVNSEVVMGPSGVAVWASSIRRWEPPHECDVVTDSDRARIIDNLRRTFRFQGFEIDVI